MLGYRIVFIHTRTQNKNLICLKLGKGKATNRQTEHHVWIRSL
uniref:Uncharacterized protein n=1 Tax=Anguilla anguilla TaxID=7936 RepID=A0A0E9VM89_ANGAN